VTANRHRSPEEALEVEPGTKAEPFAAEDDSAKRLVHSQAFPRVDECRKHRPIQSVTFFWTIESHVCDPVRDFDGYPLRHFVAPRAKLGARHHGREPSFVAQTPDRNPGF
jgi:hypothetical protein